MNKSNVIKLINYIINNTNLSESSISYSNHNVEYAINELTLELKNYSYNKIIFMLYSLSISKNINNYNDFEDILVKQNEKVGIQKKILKKYSLYIPISINITTNYTLKIFNKNIALIKIDDLMHLIPESFLSIENIKKSILQFDNIYIPNVFIRFIVYASDENESIDKFWQFYCIIKPLLEIQKSWGTKYLIHKNFDERSKIKMPDWLILKNANGYSYNRYKVSIQKEINSCDFKNEELSKISDLAKIILNKDNDSSFDFLIYRSLLLYNDALEQIDYNYCFLAFWQILEIISLAERNNGNTKIVVDRIEPLTGVILKGKIFLRETLELFARKRCDLVHKGVGSVTNEDINGIKLISEISIAWTINNKKYFHDINVLEQFYNLRSADRKRILSIKKAIEILNKKT